MSGRHDPPRSPLFGTATFSTLSPSDTYDYDSRSSTPRPSAQANTEQNGRYSRRSPPEYDDDSDDASFADQAEVEAALNMIDNELNNAEDVVTAWSTPRAEGVLPERDRRHLSTITERTEGSSRPLSGGHSRYATDPGATPTPERVLAIPRSHTPDRGIVRAHTPGRRVGELAAFYEERSTTPGHRRTPSAPAGPRSPSPYAGTSTGYGYGTTTGYDNSTGLTGLTSSRYTATGYGTTTGYSTSGYGGSSGYSSPTKSRSTISSGSSGYDPTTLSSLLSPPLRTDTPTNTRTDNTRTTETYTSNTFTTFSGTNSTTATSSTATPTATGLRRPQTSPRSPLTSVRNIVAAWKQRTPSLGTGKGLKKDSPSPTRDEGLFSLRRRAERGEARLREEALQERRSGPSLREPAGRSEMASFGSAVIPPAFDISELGAYANARGSQEPLRIGLLWYLNVHGSEPYRWQRCQALLYPHMLLLSWIAPAGGRGVVTLDLLNCTEVRSVPSPLHPSARDDVGTIAARAQSGETTGQSGEMGLMEMLCPFQLLYSDGVERLGAESARERVRWVSAIWEALDRAVTIPDRSVSGSPTGSIRTIRSMASTASRQSGSQAASGSGSASTVFVPPTDTIPDLSDLQSISGSSTFSLTRRSSRAQHTRAADDGALSNQSFVYPGDPRVIGPSRSSSIRRTTSLTDLDREFATATSRGPGGPRAFGIARFGTRLPSTRTTTAEDDDEAFFSTGSRTSGTDSTFYSLPSATDVVSDAPSRTLKTEVSPSTLSFRRTASASYLGDSHSGSSSSRTRTSPSHGSSGSQTSLSRMQAVRRRAAGSSSRTFTTTYLGSDETSDKENSGSYTASDSRSTGASDEYSSGYDRSSSGRDLSMSTLESYSSYSGTYSSTYSDSYTGSNTRTTSSGGPPSYPSSSAPSEPGAQDPGQPPSTPSGSYSSAPSIPSLDEYATAEKASTVFSEGDRASTIYSIAEKASTEFSVAEAASTTYSTVERAPTEYGSIPSELPLDEVDRESVKLPTEVPTIPSSPASVHPENIPLPPSVSPSIASVSPPAVVPPSPTEPVSTSLLSTESSPTESSVSPSPVRSPTELTPTPSTPSVLEPSLPSPSIRESMWAPETDESYESSFLGASPSVQSIAVPEGLDASIETSFLRPSPSPVTPGTRLSTVPETISVSAASSPMPPSPPSLSPTPSSPSTITPTASPLTMTVSSVTPTQSTRSPTVSSLTPTVPSLTPTVSSPSLPPLPSPSPATFTSLLRTPSTLSTASSISMRSSVLYPKSLLDVPLEDVPTEPSLLSTGSSRSSPRLPLPEDIPLPSSPAASLVPPSVPPSVSEHTQSTNIPSIRDTLDTIPSRPPSAILSHDVNRLLQYLHEIDDLRGVQNQGIADNVRAIRNELTELSNFLTNRPPVDVPPPVPLKDRSVGQTPLPSPRPAGPREGPHLRGDAPRRRPPHLVPIPVTPPPLRPASPSSLSSSMSWLSSHHSDDFSLMEEEQYPSSPRWRDQSDFSESLPSSPVSDLPFASEESLSLPPTPRSSAISSSLPSSGPYLSRSSSPATSTLSSATARPRDDASLSNLRELLDQLRNQTEALQNGQRETHDLLNDLRDQRPEEEKLSKIENLLQDLLNRRVPGMPAPPSDIYDSGSETSSALGRLRQRWDELNRAREQREPLHLHMPIPVRPGPSLDEQLADLLTPGPPLPPPVVQQPPPLVPLMYRPFTGRRRLRSLSPTTSADIPPRSATVPLQEEPIELYRWPHPSYRPPRRRTGRRTGPAMSSGVVPSIAPTVPSDFGPTTRRPQSDDIDMLREIERLRAQRARPPAQGVPTDLHDRPPTAPPDMGGPRPVSGTWYRRRPATAQPPGQSDLDEPEGASAGAAAPSAIQMPQLDTMMGLLRENRLAQMASIDQQREIMRYMRGLNEWLERDVHDRQAEMRGVSARVDQLRQDLGRLSNALTGQPVVAQGPGVMPSQGAPVVIQPGAQQQPGGAVVIPPPPVMSGTPFIPGFVPQPPIHQPVVPSAVIPSAVYPQRTSSPGSPFIPPHPGFVPGMPQPVIPDMNLYGPGPPPPQPYVPARQESDEDSPIIPPRPDPVIVIPPPGQAGPPGQMPTVIPLSHTQLSPSESSGTGSSATQHRWRPPSAPHDAQDVARPGTAHSSHTPQPPAVVHVHTAPSAPAAAETEPRVGSPRHPELQPQQQPIIIAPEGGQQAPSAPSQAPIIIQPAPAGMPGMPMPGVPPMPGMPMMPPAQQPTVVFQPQRSRSSRSSSSGSSGGTRRSHRTHTTPVVVVPSSRREDTYGDRGSHRDPTVVFAPTHRTRSSSHSSRTHPRHHQSTPSRHEGPAVVIQPAPSQFQQPPVVMTAPRTHGHSPPPIIVEGDRPRTHSPSVLRVASRSSRHSPSRPVVITGSRTHPSRRSPSPTYFRDRSRSPRRLRQRRPTHRPRWRREGSYEYSPSGRRWFTRPRSRDSSYDDAGGRRRRRPYSRSPGGRRYYWPRRSPARSRSSTPSYESDRHDERRRRPHGASHEPRYVPTISRSPRRPPTHLGSEFDPDRRTYRPTEDRRSPSPQPIPVVTEGRPSRIGTGYDPRRRPSQAATDYDPARTMLHRPPTIVPEMEEGPSDTPTYAEQEAPPHAIRRPRTISRPGTQRPTAVVREPSYERPPTHLAHEEEELPEEEVPDDGYHPPVTPSRTPPRPGRSVAPTRVDREEVRRSPSGRTELESQLRRARPEEPFIPYVPTQPSARAATEALPGSEVGRIPLVDRPLSPVPVVQDDGRPPSPTRSAVTHIPPPRPPTMYDFPDRGRFDDLERNILDAARENEDHRERHFMEQEEARERIFEDNEARREEETAARRDALLSDLEQRFARRPSSILHVPPPGGEGVPIVTQEGDEAAAEGDGRQSGADDQVSVVSTIHHATAEAASRHAAEILEAVALERQQIAADHEAALNSLREAIAQEREVHVLEMREAIRKEREDAMREREEERERIRQELQEDRVRLDDDRDIRVRELEEELARVRAELEEEKARRITDDVETRERERAEVLERDENIRGQLTDITNLVQQQRDEMERKRTMMEQRWEEKNLRREEKDNQLSELKEMVEQLVEDRNAARARWEAEQDKPTIENVLAELRQQNDELRETLQLMRTELSEDSQRQHNETLEAVRATAQEQVPFNIQGYLDEFSKALATEVRMLLGEVGKLREERRALQHEIGCLLCMRSKYGPDGEFNEGWKPPAAAPTEAPPPESVPAAPEEPIRAPPAWRTVRERGPSRRRRRDQSAPPAAPQPVPTVAPSIPVVTQQGGHTSWATWQPDPTYAPTPPSREPTLLVPEQPSPGLFGPRSPRTSVRQG